MPVQSPCHPSHAALRRGLTLIELLVVVAILAAIAGTALVAFDGLEERAASGQSVFNTNAVQRTVLQHKQLEKSLPSDLDTGLWSDASPASSLRITDVDDGSGEFGALHEQLVSWTRVGALPSEARLALRAAGIDTLRYLNAGLRSVAVGNPGELESGLFPNSAFKSPTKSAFSGSALTYYGKGVAFSLLADGSARYAAGDGVQATDGSGNLLYYLTDADGDRIDAEGDKEGSPDFGVPVETSSASDNGTANDPKFDGEVTVPASADIPALVFVGDPGSSQDLRNEAFGLGVNRSKAELVVLLGLGSDASIVKAGDVTMVEAPYSTKAGKKEYGRFFLAVHLGSDADDDRLVTGSEIFAEAVFLGVLDPTGMWTERALTDFDGSN